MNEYKRVKWKGVKKGDLTTKVDPHSKDFWEAFFTDYIKPKCEFDNVSLECKSINVSRFIDTTNCYGGRPSSKKELIIEVELKCPVCGTEYSGIGNDIEIGIDGSVGIGSFNVHTTKFNISR